MKKYINLLFEFFRNNLIREMEFRGNFFLWLAVELFWLLLQIAVIEIFFQYTKNISGWTKNEIFLLVGLYRIIRGIYGFFAHINIANIPEMVDKGEMDFVLAKPLNPLFLATFRHQEYSELGTILFGASVLFYASFQLQLFSLLYFFSLIFYIILGVVSLFCLTLIFVTLSFYLKRLNAVNSFFDVINNFLLYPTDIFNKNSLSLILPFAIVVTLPSKLLLSKAEPHELIIEILSALFLLTVTYLFWFFSLRRYSSASS